MFQSLSLAPLVRRTEHLPSTSAAETLHYRIHTSSNPRSRSRSFLHPRPLPFDPPVPRPFVHLPRQTPFFHSLLNRTPPLYSIFVIILLPSLFPFTRFIIISPHLFIRLLSQSLSLPFPSPPSPPCFTPLPSPLHLIRFSLVIPLSFFLVIPILSIILLLFFFYFPFISLSFFFHSSSLIIPLSFSFHSPFTPLSPSAPLSRPHSATSSSFTPSFILLPPPFPFSSPSSHLSSLPIPPHPSPSHPIPIPVHPPRLGMKPG